MFSGYENIQQNPIEKPKWLGDTININIFGNKIDYIPIIWGYI
jgi:hypothetical protein